MENPSETVVWEGNPSQLTNIGTYLACALVAAAIVVAGAMIRPEAYWVLFVPVLIFGVAAVEAALSGLSPRPHLLILAAMALAALPLTPLAAGAAARQALE